MVRLESFHSMSYYRNNIQECVLQGDYGCDSDAVDVRRRWGLLGIIAALQLVKKKQLRKKTNCGFCFMVTVSISETHF